jgi:ribosomal protein S18 acetylase RimI-like enzyme
MYRLAVVPEHRRAGIGHELVDAGEAHLRGLGARRVTALVAKEDSVARAVWLSAGYQDDVRIGRFVRNL